MQPNKLRKKPNRKKDDQANKTTTPSASGPADSMTIAERRRQRKGGNAKKDGNAAQDAGTSQGGLAFQSGGGALEGIDTREDPNLLQAARALQGYNHSLAVRAARQAARAAGTLQGSHTYQSESPFQAGGALQSGNAFPPPGAFQSAGDWQGNATYQNESHFQTDGYFQTDGAFQGSDTYQNENAFYHHSAALQSNDTPPQLTRENSKSRPQPAQLVLTPTKPPQIIKRVPPPKNRSGIPTFADRINAMAERARAVLPTTEENTHPGEDTTTLEQEIAAMNLPLGDTARRAALGVNTNTPFPDLTFTFTENDKVKSPDEHRTYSSRTGLPKTRSMTSAELMQGTLSAADLHAITEELKNTETLTLVEARRRRATLKEEQRVREEKRKRDNAKERREAIEFLRMRALERAEALNVTISLPPSPATKEKEKAGKKKEEERMGEMERQLEEALRELIRREPGRLLSEEEWMSGCVGGAELRSS
ncbi:hypothetical protein HYFRA_00007320 [Hymenoscyphus fraxineus]|uniref:Uncharacterized protein n=1 Tax=Hymenoscyphus fraxineus TaxID=746836 RepID=A0A9N9KSN0_9HELO|nr:hypothetical protein HYFRA_00007320 [Hymenoscyphus fraxineus]